MFHESNLDYNKEEAIVQQICRVILKKRTVKQVKKKWQDAQKHKPSNNRDVLVELKHGVLVKGWFDHTNCKWLLYNDGVSCPCMCTEVVSKAMLDEITAWTEIPK